MTQLFNFLSDNPYFALMVIPYFAFRLALVFADFWDEFPLGWDEPAVPVFDGCLGAVCMYGQITVWKKKLDLFEFSLPQDIVVFLVDAFDNGTEEIVFVAIE